MTRFSAALMSLAIWLLPPNRKAWGEAMRGEFETLAFGERLSFGLGCLGTSFKENVASKEGLARLGLFLILAFAAVLGGLWLWSWTLVFGATNALELGNVLKMPWMLVLGLAPVSIGFAAIRAAKAPTDRHHLAREGVKMISNLALVVGGSQIVGTICVVLTCYVTPRCAAVDYSAYTLGLYGAGLVLISIISKRSARALRNAAFIGLVLVSAAIAFLSWGSIGVSLSLSAFITLALVPTIPLLMMTLGGALLIWMQRPASPTPQP